ncbi:hypothetical protein [Croceivirga lutea]|uniref:hypothetical protein n=1 Tax=Croceivirga lutea TaxID=1775167 RepID=UPI00163B10BE|nr:hypothetical protein [Croceivirga lutea]
MLCFVVAGLSYGQTRFWEDAMKKVEESNILIAQKNYDAALANIHSLKNRLMAKRLTEEELSILQMVVGIEMNVAALLEDFDTVLKRNQEFSKKLYPDSRRNETFAIAYYGNVILEQYYIYLADADNLATLESVKKNLYIIKNKIKAHRWTHKVYADTYDHTIEVYANLISTKMKELGAE